MKLGSTETDNLARKQQIVDWVIEGYGGEIDREQLRVCCNWRRDFLYNFFKMLQGYGVKAFDVFVDKYDNGLIQYHQICGLTKP
jgi:hypothetical protein